MDIHYDRCNVSNRLRSEIIRAKGHYFWTQLIEGAAAPSDDMDDSQCSACMRPFMQKLQQMLPPEEIKSILVNVRHDLRPDDFDWAVRLFNQTGSIDEFSIELQKICIEAVADSYSLEKEPGGRSPVEEYRAFVQDREDIFYGRRHGNVILAQAIPYDLHAYLHASSDKEKRHALCHCQFARESILQAEGQVSSLLCECSLGHTMMLWETVLGRTLEGEVVESALIGSDRCLFMIKLPDEVIELWT